MVLLIDGAAGLEHMGKDYFQGCVQIVDFYHAIEHAGLVLAARMGKDHPDYKTRLRRWAILSHTQSVFCGYFVLDN